MRSADVPQCRNRRPPTEAERDARRRADRERIEQAARALLTSEGWQRWIRVRATNGLSRYSLRNQWLIACECHARGVTPTYVAGFRAFLALNRCVHKGETAIRILAPVAVKQRDDAGDETGEKRIGYRTVSVFDVSMTDPLPGVEPVQLTPPAEPIEGDSHEHLIEPLQNLARELGYGIDVRDLPDTGPGGWCDPARREIIVASGPANREVRTLVHELAHALGIGYGQYGRQKAEVLVDCVTYVVCSSVGLDVGGESIPYVAGWGEDGALDAIREYAETIDAIARRIESAIGDGKSPPTKEDDDAGVMLAIRSSSE
jgi:N-terminal domain of anti-restriction factor ArdC